LVRILAVGRTKLPQSCRCGKHAGGCGKHAAAASMQAAEASRQLRQACRQSGRRCQAAAAQFLEETSLFFNSGVGPGFAHLEQNYKIGDKPAAVRSVVKLVRAATPIGHRRHCRPGNKCQCGSTDPEDEDGGRCKKSDSSSEIPVSRVGRKTGNLRFPVRPGTGTLRLSQLATEYCPLQLPVLPAHRRVSQLKSNPIQFQYATSVRLKLKITDWHLNAIR
jgi:hypothetical protein